MSDFIVSARKYRPRKFDEVVGQQHVSKTLKNAIAQNSIAHAYLFCGPRGVGKTTCARILAMAINCQNRGEDQEPCGICESCTSFTKQASLNIIELDAASNNSVEHIRSLNEQVRIPPQSGAYKVFIIDEVHMLSQSAFNAFLKTLEEPPSYAIFILATTEKHKIIPTILSRCQVFDFKRIQIESMLNQLQSICDSEGISAEQEALYVIAEKADGALRDALSIFDRISSFSRTEITYKSVIENLNILDYDYYFSIIEGFISEDIVRVMGTFHEILLKGFDPDIFLQGLGEHCRQLLVAKHDGLKHILQVSPTLLDRYTHQANLIPQDFLVSMMDIINHCDINYKMAKNKVLHVEMSLVKINYWHQQIERTQLKSLVEKKKVPSS